MSSSVQYHFVSQTASTFNILVVSHLGLAILSSIFDSDVTAALAVMGIIAVLNYNIGLLFLYLIFTPPSIVVDIVRMVAVDNHYKKAGAVFFILLRVAEICVKLVATYFGYQVYRSASEGDSGYEQINGGPSQAPPTSVPAGYNPAGDKTPQNPFVPPYYPAAQVGTGPVVQSSMPPPPPST
eukprot:g776.t1